jgi:hypothetical protein
MYREWLACIEEYEMQLQAMLEIVEDMEELSSRLDAVNDASEWTAEEQRSSFHAIADMLYLQRKLSEKLHKLKLV